MTIQEAFDKVWSWFVVQGKPRAVVNGMCRLRTPTGAKCAVGVLIPDEQYRDALDRRGITDYHESVPALEGLPLDFLTALQTAHDKDGRDLGMTGALKQFAKRWHLTIPKTINTLDFKDKSDGQATHDSPQAVAGSVGMAPAGSALEPAGNPAATC